MPPSRGSGDEAEVAISASSSVPPLPEAAAEDQQEGSSGSVAQGSKDAPVPAWVHFAAGGLGGMCGGIVTAPFDLVKTRLQSSLFKQAEEVAKASASRKGKGKAVSEEAVREAVVQVKKRGKIRVALRHFVETGHILRDVYVHEGFRALFRGLGPTLVGVIPARSINFFTYGNGKLVFASYLDLSTDAATVHLLSAATAGVATATATNPIWVVKTRLQLQQQLAQAHGRGRNPVALDPPLPPRSRGVQQHFAPSFRSLSTATVGSSGEGIYVRPFRSSWECIGHIWRHEGLRGFYKGLSASYLGVAEGTIQWTLYERFKLWSRRPKAVGGEGWEEPAWAKAVAAGGAKVIATAITYPHEVVRTRMRQAPPPPPAKPKYTTLLSTFRIVLQEEGWASMYSGLSPHLMRVVPNAIVMYGCYESCLSLARRYRSDDV